MTIQVQSENIKIPISGRGGIILALGIVSLLLFGPILGIPAWIMGRRDLKLIRNGEMDPRDKNLSQIGMTLGIIGTFASPLFWLGAFAVTSILYISFTYNSIQASMTTMTSEISTIADLAYEYRNRPAGTFGGGGSYEGFQLPAGKRRTEIGQYYVKALSDDNLQIVGNLIEYSHDGIAVIIDEKGRVTSRIFSGKFEMFHRYPFDDEILNRSEDDPRKEI
jgi:hypothetical protein